MNYEGKLWPGDGEQIYLSSTGASTSTKAQVIVVHLSGAFRCALTNCQRRKTSVMISEKQLLLLINLQMVIGSFPNSLKSVIHKWNIFKTVSNIPRSKCPGISLRGQKLQKKSKSYISASTGLTNCVKC